MIVVLPMIAVGGLVFRLIGDSQQGKADARSAGLATAAASLYLSQSGQARTDAATIARDLAGVPSAALPARMRELQSASGVVRIEVRRGGRIIAASGARAAVAPGSASPRPPAGARLSVSVSTLSASDLVRELTPPRAPRSSSGRGAGRLPPVSPIALPTTLPAQGAVTIAGTDYDAFTQTVPGFGGRRIRLIPIPTTHTPSPSAFAARSRHSALRASTATDRCGSRPASVSRPPKAPPGPNELIAEADAAHYRAKHSGKNRTEQAPVRPPVGGSQGRQASPAASKV